MHVGTAIGSGAYFSYDVRTLIREIEDCKQDYNWIVRQFILRETRAQWILLAIASITLFVSAIYNFMFQDTKLPPEVSNRMNNYSEELQQALISDSIIAKLDAIILAQIEQSTSGATLDVQTISFKVFLFALFLMAFALFLIIVGKKIKQLYPMSFFNFGRSQAKFKQIIDQRQFWWNVVIAGFAVNIGSNLVLYLFL